MIFVQYAFGKSIFDFACDQQEVFPNPKMIFNYKKIWDTFVHKQFFKCMVLLQRCYAWLGTKPSTNTQTSTKKTTFRFFTNRPPPPPWSRNIIHGCQLWKNLQFFIQCIGLWFLLYRVFPFLYSFLFRKQCMLVSNRPLCPLTL